MTCARCQGVRWVCENHPDKPWDKTLPGGCECGAGAPCPDCNTGEAPEISGQFDTIGAAVPGAPIRRGEFIGERQGPPVAEAEHFMKCPACGGWIDKRDLGQVLEHEGPLPHPAVDRPQ